MWYRLPVYFFLATFQTPAFALQDFAATPEELTMMPHYCSKGITSPPGCPATHHYCDGLKALIRVNRNRAERGHWLHEALASLKGMAVDDWPNRAPNCSLRPEAYTNLGKALLLQDKASAGQAVMYFNKALELQPGFLPAYFALSGYYFDTGKKREALGVIEQGLKYWPDSKALLRKFKELGGKTPPAPITKADVPSQQGKAMPEEQPRVPSQVVEEGPLPGLSAAPRLSAPLESSTTAITVPGTTAAGIPATLSAPVASEPPKSGTPKSPYCRFCPD